MEETSGRTKNTKSTSAKKCDFVSDLENEIKKSHPLVRKYIAAQQKEIDNLQTQLAKSKVKHDSEKAKIEAECLAKITAASTPIFNILPVSYKDRDLPKEATDLMGTGK